MTTVNVDTLLTSALFDEDRIVTRQWLSRHGDLPIDEATRKLTAFYQREQKKHPKLKAIYVVCGTLKQLPGDGDDQPEGDAGAVFSRTALIKETELDVKTAEFEKIISQGIYCLHVGEMADSNAIFLADRDEEEKFADLDAKYRPINYPAAERFRAEMLVNRSKHPAFSGPLAASTKSAVSIPESKQKAEKSVETKKMTDIRETLAKPAKAETQKTTPVKNPNTANGGSKKPNSANSNGKGKRRSGKRILIDEEENDDLDDVATVLATAEEQKRKSERVKGKGQCGCSAKSTLSQDDLFSADGSPSPMKTPSNVRERTPEPIEPETTALRRSPRKQAAIASSPPNKIKRQQQSTETFMDEDGFLVTKQVSKVIEEDLKRPPLSAPEARGKPLQPTKTNDPKKKIETKNQTKISNFFQKK